MQKELFELPFFCFYRKFQKGMLLSVAEELEKRETKQKETSKNRMWVIVGIIVTALTTLGAVMLANHLSQKTDYSLHIINELKNGKMPILLSNWQERLPTYLKSKTLNKNENW